MTPKPWTSAGTTSSPTTGPVAMTDFWTSLDSAAAHLKEVDEALTWARKSLDTARERGNGMGEVVVRRRMDKLLDTRFEITSPS